MEKETDRVEAEIGGKVGGIAYVCIVIPLLAGGLLAWINWPETSSNWSEAGTKGDFWGGHLGPPMALAGAALFFLAILLQLKQLFVQREELRLTREELASARKVYEAQRAMLERQAAAAEQQLVLNQAFSLCHIQTAVTKLKCDMLGKDYVIQHGEYPDEETIKYLLFDLSKNSVLTQRQKDVITSLNWDVKNEEHL